jgi:ATP-dependent DNA ligase
VRLYSRPGNDMTRRFRLIAEALMSLRSRSCIIGGEAVACDDNGLASFERIRYRQHDGDVFLYAFDLIELNGGDMRRDPLQVRKATLASIVAKARPGIRSSISRVTARPAPAIGPLQQEFSRVDTGLPLAALMARRTALCARFADYAISHVFPCRARQI